MKNLLFFFALLCAFSASAQTTVGEVTITYSIDSIRMDSFYLVETIDSPSEIAGDRKQSITNYYYYTDTLDLDSDIEKLVSDSLNLETKIANLQAQLTLLHAKVEAIRTARNATFLQVVSMPLIIADRRRYEATRPKKCKLFKNRKQ